MNSAQINIDFLRKFVLKEIRMNRIIKPQDIKEFIFAGNSTFTLKNSESGKHYTYKITNPNKKNNKDDIFFCKVLSGTDNVSDYSYFGYIKNNQYFHGKSSKTKISESAPSVLGFKYFLNNIENLDKRLHFYHEGRCGRCGRKLTHPESLENGIGPECSHLIEKDKLNKSQSKIKIMATF